MGAIETKRNEAYTKSRLRWVVSRCGDGGDGGVGTSNPFDAVLTPNPVGRRCGREENILTLVNGPPRPSLVDSVFLSFYFFRFDHQHRSAARRRGGSYTLNASPQPGSTAESRYREICHEIRVCVCLCYARDLNYIIFSLQFLSQIQCSGGMVG